MLERLRTFAHAYPVLLGSAMLVAALAVLLGYQSCVEKRGNYAYQQSHAYEKAGNEHQAQAQVSDKVAEDLAAKLANTKASLGRLTAERVALLKRLEAERQARIDAESRIPAPSEPVPDVRDDVIAKDEELIEAQNKQIVAYKALVSSLTISRDEWKATAELRERQAKAQEVATDAWKQAVKTSKWTGRAEGFAAGIVLGYVAGGRR